MTDRSSSVGPHWKVRSSASGLHLFDRASGVNILLDEISPPSTAWASAPRQVSIALTNACDLTCAHCYAPKASATLQIDALTRWLTELDENGCLGVGFGGGEPTLFPGFSEICSFTARNTQMAVTFTTHAHRISESLAQQLADHVHFVRVSMDGVATTYERIRGRSFQTLITHLDIIRNHFKFGINFVVNKGTVTELDKAIEIAATFGASEFLLLPERATSKSSGVDHKTMEALREWIHAYEGPLPLLLTEAASEGMPSCTPIPNEAALDAYAHIDASGNLKATSFDLAGIRIEGPGVIAALRALRLSLGENAV